MKQPIRTVELVAWDLDTYPFRPPLFHAGKLEKARGLVLQRDAADAENVVREEETDLLREALDGQLARPDLNAEMRGLDWSLGVVDLRRLLAFQRRLSFNPAVPAPVLPSQEDWQGLIDVAFPTLQPVVYEMSRDAAGRTLTLQSGNPNLHLRVTDDPSAPIAVHPGGPFFEAALYKGRWFLRDGYHRAYRLLQAGVHLLPAAIVRARTIEELGAAEPWFFPEAILLCAHPPRVCDFLDSDLTIEYNRPPTIKTLRVTMEETLSPAAYSTTSGERI